MENSSPSQKNTKATRSPHLCPRFHRFTSNDFSVDKTGCGGLPRPSAT